MNAAGRSREPLGGVTGVVTPVPHCGLMSTLRVLLFGDTHVGFDTPRRPRVERRRRGPDFLAAYQRALEPALRGEVDLVVHGGDLLHRSGLPAHFTELALAPLLRVADLGVPVFLVPGNHERSRIPHPLLALHPRLHIFHGPDTFAGVWGGLRVAVSGFPYARRVRGAAFREELEATRFRDHPADLRLLCVHQAVEGATVGPSGFTFRRGADVIAASDLPGAFDAVLSGHIHRAQVLRRDLAGAPLASPVFYAGSVERTSFAEANETKGYMRLFARPGARVESTFVPLPTRPMRQLELGGPDAEDQLTDWLRHCEADAVVQLRWLGPGPPPSASRLRQIAPESMNLAVSWRANESPRPGPPSLARS